MDEEIEPAVALADRLKSRVDFLLIRHVARHDERVRNIFRQFLDVFLEAFALVCKGQFRAPVKTRFGASPGDRTLVCDPENHSNFVFKHNVVK
jgi:hypothetical protein